MITDIHSLTILKFLWGSLIDSFFFYFDLFSFFIGEKPPSKIEIEKEDSEWLGGEEYFISLLNLMKLSNKPKWKSILKNILT